MKIIYEVKFILKLRSAIKEVAELEDKINQSMQEFGYDEKLSTEAECFSAIITAEKELSSEEQNKMKVLLEAQIIKSMPKYDIRLKSFSRKSEQSVVQSAE